MSTPDSLADQLRAAAITRRPFNIKLVYLNTALKILEQAENAKDSYLMEKLVEQRRDLGAQHDETLDELKCLRQVAKEEIDRLERENRELQGQLVRCGKENCMGYEASEDGFPVARWVRIERLAELEHQLCEKCAERTKLAADSQREANLSWDAVDEAYETLVPDHSIPRARFWLKVAERIAKLERRLRETREALTGLLRVIRLSSWAHIENVTDCACKQCQMSRAEQVLAHGAEGKGGTDADTE